MQNREGQRYLDPTALAKIGNLELIAKFVVEGFISGLHKSPYHGFSVEFAQYRNICPAMISNISTGKPMDEPIGTTSSSLRRKPNLNCYLLLDTSESMTYGSGELTKCNTPATLSLRSRISWQSNGMPSDSPTLTKDSTNTSPPEVPPPISTRFC